MMTYLPCGTDVVFQEKVNVTVVIVVEPSGMVFVTEDAIVYDVRFVAVIVSWIVSKKSPRFVICTRTVAKFFWKAYGPDWIVVMTTLWTGVIAPVLM